MLIENAQKLLVVAKFLIWATTRLNFKDLNSFIKYFTGYLM